MDLFDDDTNVFDGDDLKINKKFAKEFEEKKRKRELMRLQDAAAEEGSSSSSSTWDSSEDSDAVLDTRAKGEKFLNMLPMIAKGKPTEWDDEDPEEGDEAAGRDVAKRKKKQGQKKPLLLGDFVTDALLKEGSTALLSDDEDGEGQQQRRRLQQGRPQLVPYNEEQQQLKMAFVGKGDEAEGVEEGEGEEEDDDDFFKLKSGPSSSSAAAAAPGPPPPAPAAPEVKSYWMNDRVDEDEKFLRDYILHQKWIDRNKKEENEDDSGSHSSSSSSFVEKQEEFEAKYNFRFEEEGGDSIAGVMRGEGAARLREKRRRADKEAKRRERKQRQQEERDRELRRLKALQKQETEARLREILGATDDDGGGGGGDVGPQLLSDLLNDPAVLAVLDDEAEFDAHAHDLVAEKLSQYISKGEMWKAVNEEGKEEAKEEGEEEAVEEEEEEEEDQEEEKDKDDDDDESDKTRKRTSAIIQSVNKYLSVGQEEGGFFKYTRTVPLAGGMDTEEILALDDQVLNSRLSIKKLAPYRPDQQQLASYNWAKARKKWERKEKKMQFASTKKRKKT